MVLGGGSSLKTYKIGLSFVTWCTSVEKLLPRRLAIILDGAFVCHQ
jgi:hypothetical protein